MERQCRILGHLAIFAKKDVRAFEHQALSWPKEPRSWPLRSRCDQLGFDWIGEGVDDFAHHVFGAVQRNDADLFGGPNIFPAPNRGVDALGDKLVQPAVKGRHLGIRVGEDDVVMVGHHANGVDDNVVFSGGHSQAIAKNLIIARGWLEPELALGGTASDEIGGSCD